MANYRKFQVKHIWRPSLPSRDIKRWTPGRKAEVAAAITEGLITVDDACTRWASSREELTGWVIAYATFNSERLRAGRNR